MDKQAAEMMGEAVEAGVQLEAQELVKAAIGGGIVGKLTGNLVAGAELKDPSLPGDHKGIFYVALGATKLGFFSVKRGFFKNSLDQLLVAYPRAEIKALEIEGGMMSTVHIVMQDGTHHALMCAKINLKNLNKIKEALGF